MTADRGTACAHLQVTRALARQSVVGEERGALLAVVGDLTEATKIFREETHRSCSRCATSTWHWRIS